MATKSLKYANVSISSRGSTYNSVSVRGTYAPKTNVYYGRNLKLLVYGQSSGNFTVSDPPNWNFPEPTIVSDYGETMTKDVTISVTVPDDKRKHTIQVAAECTKGSGNDWVWNGEWMGSVSSWYSTTEIPLPSVASFTVDYTVNPDDTFKVTATLIIDNPNSHYVPAIMDSGGNVIKQGNKGDTTITYTHDYPVSEQGNTLTFKAKITGGGEIVNASDKSVTLPVHYTNLYVKNSGAWVRIKEAYVIKGGAWKKVQDIQTLQGGEWKK